MSNFLDKTGLSYFWGKIKAYITSQLASKLSDAVFYKHIDGKLPDPANTEYYTELSYGNGVYLAGGTLPTVYSQDGMNWSECVYGNISVYSNNGIFFVNGKFYVGSHAVTYVSSDGIDWTIVDDLEYLCAMAYGNGRIVALIKDSTTCYYSDDDGSTWNPITIPFASNNWTSAIYAGGKFVAVAQGSNMAIYSNDGINWLQATLPYTQFNSLAYGNGMFVAIAGAGLGLTTTFAYSSDGVTWTQGDLPATISMGGCVIFANGKFFIAGRRRYFLYSEDGISWNQIESVGDLYPLQIVYGDGMFVAIDTSGNACYSDDGINWVTEFHRLISSDGVDISDGVRAAIGGSTLTRTIITLPASGWSSNAQTVTVTGVLADESAQLIQPMPAIASQNAYISAGIICSGQGENQLTFTCSTTPTEDISLYVVITEVSA